MNRAKDAVIIVLFVAVVYLLATRDGTRSVTDDSVVTETSIAVLPYLNMSGDAENEYLSDLLWDKTINALAKHADLRVTSRSSSASFEGSLDEVESIGAELGVSYVIEGAVRTADDHVRVTAQLIRVKNGALMWKTIYDRDVDALDAIASDIAESVAHELAKY